MQQDMDTGQLDQACRFWQVQAEGLRDKLRWHDHSGLVSYGSADMLGSYDILVSAGALNTLLQATPSSGHHHNIRIMTPSDIALCDAESALILSRSLGRAWTGA